MAFRGFQVLPKEIRIFTIPTYIFTTLQKFGIIYKIQYFWIFCLIQPWIWKPIEIISEYDQHLAILSQPFYQLILIYELIIFLRIRHDLTLTSIRPHTKCYSKNVFLLFKSTKIHAKFKIFCIIAQIRYFCSYLLYTIIHIFAQYAQYFDISII